MHSYRSMSLGSLNRAPPQNNYANNLMYTTSSLSQRMDMDDDDTNKLSNNNLSAYYGNHQQQYSNNGFPPLPSPSSMTSSPNTPMLSPVRQSFSSSSQAPPGRHYSMSSTGSIQRFNNRNSFDMNSIHPHIIPEVTYDQRVKQENNNNASPNIGQLLNPVHPHTKSTDSANHDTLFQSMDIPTNNSSTTGGYSEDYSTSKLPSIPQQQQQQQQQQQRQASSDYATATYGGNYYIQRPQQPHQPLANTHSISALTSNIVPTMFRNGMVLPPQSSMYNDDSQTGGPELGMEPLMLK
jgi:hypothetical protein